MKKIVAALLVAGLTTATTAQADELKAVAVDEKQVAQWNGFADKLYQFHQRQLQGRETKRAERLGGYHELPNFYREVSFYDAKTEQLLSRVQWESQQPEVIHQIEVFVYDNQGRVVRDYLARYLPVYRNAPRQTLINLHHYDKDVHGFRQFDASDNRIYEKCSARRSGTKVLIELNEDEIERAEANNGELTKSGTYRRCFGNLQKTAGIYLAPQ